MTCRRSESFFSDYEYRPGGRGEWSHLVAAEDSRAGHLSRQVVLIRAVYRWLVGAEGGSSALWRPLRLCGLQLSPRPSHDTHCPQDNR